jgi:hypothetical protein
MDELGIKEMKTEIEYLKEQLKHADDFISQIENDCTSFVDALLNKVCKRAIRRMNKETNGLVRLSEDLPVSFSLFDQLTILLQSKDYDEIFFPPGVLSDYIDNVLDDELNKLTEMEKTILFYSDCHGDFGSFYDVCDIRPKLYERFGEIQNEHYECRKIQNYIKKNGF